ncbi:hypothetical protein H4R34_004559 [Dimargaris verticillata]|uniref:Mitochondrial outer membrane transport complex Sam37/metaxin N-terminal domain-containing protein n=1 Tax=Dimargaris verticillata TaxID=2761393 RepID=A0A9W8AYP0_9FUNG|nr:hypothetical protein H4R34_004559 [Dimargaris verticillata]
MLTTYLQLTDLEWSVAFSNDSAQSPTGELPFIRDDHVVIGGVHNILTYLKQQYCDLDCHLSDQQRAEARGFVSLLTDIFHDVLLYHWYAHTGNFTHGVRPAWAGLVAFPQSVLLPTRLRGQGLARLDCKHHVADATAQRVKDRRAAVQPASEAVPEIVQRLRARNGASDSVYTKHMNALAHKGYQTLAALLGSQSYTFGSKPCTVDAFLYAYLCLHMFDDNFSTPCLRSLVVEHYPRLAEYHERMHTHLADCEVVEVDVSSPSASAFVQGLSQSLAQKVRHWAPLAYFLPPPPPWASSPPSDAAHPLASPSAYDDTAAENSATSDADEDSALKRQRRLHNVYTVVSMLTALSAYLMINGFFASKESSIPYQEYMTEEQVFDTEEDMDDDEDDDEEEYFEDE